MNSSLDSKFATQTLSMHIPRVGNTQDVPMTPSSATEPPDLRDKAECGQPVSAHIHFRSVYSDPSSLSLVWSTQDRSS